MPCRHKCVRSPHRLRSCLKAIDQNPIRGVRQRVDNTGARVLSGVGCGMTMGVGSAAVLRHQIKLIATGVLGLGLSATTIVPSAMLADERESSPPPQADHPHDPLRSINEQISGIRSLLLNQTSALQKQTAALQDQTAALEKKLDAQTAALEKRLDTRTLDIERKLDTQTAALRTEIGKVRADLNTHVAEHSASHSIETTRPPPPRRVVHVHRYYYPCCVPCWW